MDGHAQRATPDRWKTLRSHPPPAPILATRDRFRPHSPLQRQSPDSRMSPWSAAGPRRAPTYPRRGASDHPYHRRGGRPWNRRGHHLGAGPPPAQLRLGRGDLLGGRRTLHGEQLAALGDQGHRPSQELRQGRESARGDHVETPLLGPLLRSLADHLDPRPGPAARMPRRGRPPGEPSARPGSRADRGARSPGRARGGRRPSRGRPRWRPRGTRGASRPQFTRCRSHSRGTSRGPIRPRVTPSVARKSAYASSTGSRSGGKISARTTGSGADDVSRETSAITQGGSPRSAAAPRPRTPTSDRPPPPRRARPSARTGSSVAVPHARPTP